MTKLDFHKTIDRWMAALEVYSDEELLLKPSPTSWSIGQVYMHVIDATNWFLDQCRTCCSNNNNNVKEVFSTAAERIFANNELPDRLLEGPPDNDFTPQPESRRQIQQGLLGLRHKIEATELELLNNHCLGKTRHPGLGYFGAWDWFRFAEMHCRHHFRQKSRLDAFLQEHKAT